MKWFNMTLYDPDTIKPYDEFVITGDGKKYRIDPLGHIQLQVWDKVYRVSEIKDKDANTRHKA